MKRITLFFAVLLASVTMYAQDLETATNLYNSAATVLNEGKRTEALKMFQDALEQASIIGPEAEELATNCKNVIPLIHLTIGKELANTDVAKAVPSLQTAIEKGEEYGVVEVVTEAKNLIPQLYMKEGNSKLNAKDYPGAIAEYKKILEFNPSHALAYLRIGMASSRTSNDAETISALEKAAEFGQKANADKELSKFYLVKAVDLLKAKDLANAYDYSIKANDILENAQALSIAGKAAYASKKYQDAINAYEKYLAVKPNASDANQTMFQLAASFEALKDNAKACGYYKQILKDPSLAEYANHKITQLKCN